MAVCDKCGLYCEPSNNAALYSAALSSLIGKRVVTWADGTKHRGYTPNQGALFGDPAQVIPLFRRGIIIYHKPVESVNNVMQHIPDLGRHLFPIELCDGSTSRQQQITQGKWGDGAPMDGLAHLAWEAYHTILKLPAPPRRTDDEAEEDTFTDITDIVAMAPFMVSVKHI